MDIDDSTRDTALRRTAAGVAAVFLLAGVFGFVPGVTTHVGDITFAGHESGAELLGIFHVSVLHNLVHLAFGVVGLVLSRTKTGAGSFLVGGGALYFLLAVYGTVVDPHSAANVVPLDRADNWLHLGLAIGMVGLSIVLWQPPRTGPRAPRAGRRRAAG